MAASSASKATRTYCKGQTAVQGFALFNVLSIQDLQSRNDHTRTTRQSIRGCRFAVCGLLGARVDVANKSARSNRPMFLKHMAPKP